jgi:hypothetical protein
MITQKLIFENGDPNVSYANALNLEETYGKILGVVHCVAPFEGINSDTKMTEIIPTHVTQIFYAKGYNHTARGFMIGCEAEATDIETAKCLGLISVIFRIPGIFTVVDVPTILNLNSIKDQEYLLEQKRPVYFSFQVPEHAMIGTIRNLPGWTAYIDCVSLLKDDYEEVVHQFGVK